LDNPVPVIATSFVAAVVLPHLIHPLEFSIDKHSPLFYARLGQHVVAAPALNMGNQLATIQLEIE